MFKRTVFFLHMLVGVTLGLVLILIGTTGALMAFDDPIMSAMGQGVMRVEPRAAPALSPDAVLARFRAQRPDATATILTLDRRPGGSPRVTFLTPGGGTKTDKLYLDPYDGHVLGKTPGEVFFAKVLLLHRTLLFPGETAEIGSLIVGSAAVALVFFAMSGLYLRWPANPRDWRAWTPQLQRRGRQLHWSLHSVIGTVFFPLYLLSAATGTTFAFDGWRKVVVTGLTGAPPTGTSNAQIAAAAAAHAASKTKPKPAAIDPAWATFVALEPDRPQTVIITVPKKAGDKVRIRYLAKDAPHMRAYDEIVVDGGRVTTNQRFLELPLGQQVANAMVALHRGAMFGPVGRVLFMLSAISLATTGVIGLMLFVDRRRKKAAAWFLARRAAATPALDGKPILVAYASQTGATEQIARRTADALCAGGQAATLKPLGALSLHDLSEAHLLLVVTSTFGSGDAPDSARPLERHLLGKAANLSGLRYAVLAMGDAGYPDFCGFGRRVDAWLQASGAEPVFGRIDVDSRSPTASLDIWRSHLTLLGAAPSAEILPAPAYQSWRLVDRRALNPGGCAAEAWHVTLTPIDEAHLTWTAGDIAEILPAPRGVKPAARSYSIASLPQSGRLELLVRRTVRTDGSPGLGSGWLIEHAPLSSEVRLRVRANPSFHPPEGARPAILIGAGTGLAGLRAHLAHRQAAGERSAWLIFGERSQATDRLHGEEIDAWLERQVLERCDLVFSRDDPLRPYVQHRIADRAAEIRRWVLERDAALMVCGGLRMGEAVQAALAEVLGETVLEDRRRQGLYRRDVY